jgi:hypothetical protein
VLNKAQERSPSLHEIPKMLRKLLSRRRMRVSFQ